MHRIFIAMVCVSMILLSESPPQAQMINGDFSDGLAGWHTEGDASISSEGFAILRTGGIEGAYATSISRDFVTSGSMLTFRYYFDIVGPDEIKYPGFPSFGPDFFQLSLNAGENGTFDVSLAWNPTGGFIPYSMDISSIAPGTSVTLSFILFDEDDENLSMAAIDDIADSAGPVPEPATLILLGGGLVGIFLYNTRRIRSLALIICTLQILSSSPANAEMLEDNVNDMTSLEFTSPLFNTKTNILTLNMTISNISDISIFTPLKVIITGISSADVSVANPDGYTPEGYPYLDLTPFINGRKLAPGEASSAVKISFYNPRRIRFRWDQDVFAFIDEYGETGPVIDNLCLVPGESSPVCEYYFEGFGVKNPEFDMLQQKPLLEMYMYEQLRVYVFDNEEFPLTVTVNGSEALYNGEGLYYYSDMVLKDGLNTISIVATNSMGVSISREISLNIDSIPPVIEVSGPLDGAVVTTPEQWITGRVDDPDVNSITIKKDFEESENISVVDGRFTAEVMLTPGHNDIRIRATDAAGNLSDYSLDMVYVYSESGDIEGYIYNSVLGLPIAGASVAAISGGDDYRITVSDGNGYYRLEGVRSGDLTLSVRKDGYIEGSLNIFSPGGSTSYVQDVALTPVNNTDTFTLTGQVKNRGGLPLSGATVSAIVSIDGTPLLTASDYNGIYIISGIPRTSFIAEASYDMYETASLNINSGIYNSYTTVLVLDFVLKDIVSSIRIISPEDGWLVSSEEVLVTGFIKDGGSDAGVRVNGILAQVYNGYFVANDVPVIEGPNRITAEMITASGTILSDSVNIFLSGEGAGVRIHAQETGMVPVELTVDIESPYGVSITDYSMKIEGPDAAELMSDGPLYHKVFIKEPGAYTLTFEAIDSSGNRYKDTFGFIGLMREDVEEILRPIWMALKDYLITDRIEDALLLFTPETRWRYAEQFSLLGSRLAEVFVRIGDIEVISLKGDVAKTRVHEGSITHYVWFVRDIHGKWKIHKF